MRLSGKYLSELGREWIRLSTCAGLCLKPGSMLLIYLLVFTLAISWPEKAVADFAAVTVNGKIELTNSRLKSRDAGGVVVWLDPVNGVPQRNSSKNRQVINQRDKRFLPHVVAVETGSEIDFPNDDPFFHNVFSVYNGKRFDLGLYASGETRPVKFNRPGISYIFCNIHPHMSAVVVALETPYFAVTDKSGAFSIANVPAGNYQFNIWHERARPETLTALKRNLQLASPQLDLGTIRVSEEGYMPRPHFNKHGQEYDSPHNRPGYRKP